MTISQAVEKYLIASNIREESTHFAKKFYISDMGKCMRIRYLKRLGIKTEFSPFVYWIFALGDMLHDYGYKALEAQGILLQTEQPFENEHFTGRYDGEVKGSDSKPNLFDFKSAGQYQMKKVISGADSEENIAQILATVLLVSQTNKNISNTGIIAYLNKEPSDKMPDICFQREYHLTNTRIKDLQDEMDTLIDYYISKKIPPCNCPAWMKNYNSFLPFCSMPEKQVKKYLAMVSDKVKIISTKDKVFKVDKDEKRKELFVIEKV